MKIGAVYPQIETNGEVEALDKIGRAVEQLGYDHLLMYDHVVGAVHEKRDPPLWGPYTETDPFHDPFVAFAYLAGITQRIEFVTGILILPQRQTVLVAKQAADLDIVSRGRFRLGVGTGWNYVEYDALGESFADRGRKMDEQIPYLRRLWNEPVLSFEGRFDTMDRGAVIPRPKHRIPIYCGGFAEPAYRRAAKMADGFIFAAGLAESALPGWTRVRELLAQAGRPVEGFGGHLIVQDSQARGLAVQDTVDAMNRWRDAGGTHASVGTMGRGHATPDAHIDFLAEVRQHLDL